MRTARPAGIGDSAEHRDSWLIAEAAPAAAHAQFERHPKLSPCWDIYDNIVPRIQTTIESTISKTEEDGERKENDKRC